MTFGRTTKTIRIANRSTNRQSYLKETFLWGRRGDESVVCGIYCLRLMHVRPTCPASTTFPVDANVTESFHHPLSLNIADSSWHFNHELVYQQQRVILHNQRQRVFLNARHPIWSDVSPKSRVLNHSLAVNSATAPPNDTTKSWR